jgi:soluble lytic murein transglycosylase-like protein
MLVTRPAIAEAPTQLNSDDYTSGNLVIKDDAIQQPPPINVQPTRVQPSGGGTNSGRDIPAYSGREYSKEEVQQLIKDYSAQYGISSEVPIRIARCESGFNQFAKNRNSTASGVFQYLTGTWKGTDEAKAGLSVWDADANVKAAVKYMAIHKSTAPWVCR